MKKIPEVEDDKKIPLALGVRLRVDGLQTIIAYEPSAGEAGPSNTGSTLLLKSPVGNLGAKRVVDLSLKLEFLGRIGDLAGAKEMIGNRRTKFEHLEEYINKPFRAEAALKS
jgi:hypothetical protein